MPSNFLLEDSTPPLLPEDAEQREQNMRNRRQRLREILLDDLQSIVDRYSEPAQPAEPAQAQEPAQAEEPAEPAYAGPLSDSYIDFVLNLEDAVATGGSLFSAINTATSEPVALLSRRASDGWRCANPDCGLPVTTSNRMDSVCWECHLRQFNCEGCGQRHYTSHHVRLSNSNRIIALCTQCYTSGGYTCRCTACSYEVQESFTRRMHIHSPDREDTVCLRCVRQHGIRECDSCGGECLNGAMYRTYGSSVRDDSRSVCVRCFTNYETCDYCGHAFSNLEQHVSYGCPDDRSGGIQQHSYRPKPVFHRIGKENMYFGIELEVENVLGAVSNTAIAKEFRKTKPYLYCKRDGSLDTGFEIVTHPLSFSWIKSNRKLFAQLLNGLAKNGFRSYNSDTCGMHIHITKSAFNTMHLYRFLKFFRENEDFILLISQRKRDRLERWASISRFDGGVSSEFEPREIIHKAKHKTVGHNRYCAVNLNGPKTAEIRIFRGTLNYKSFMKNIEFVMALFEFTQAHKNTDADSFVQFVHANPQYKNLSRFIIKKTSK